MVTLEQTIRNATGWSVARVKTLCNENDVDRLMDAHALTQEFEEWMDPETKDHDVYSLEYIGKWSEYDG